MAAKWLRSGWALTVCVAALFLAVAGCVAYLQREILVAHWQVRLWLKGGDQPTRLQWLREQKHRAAVLPIAVESLGAADAPTCARAGALVRAVLADLDDPTDPDAAQLSLVAMSRLRDAYSSYCPAARREAEEAAFQLLQVHLKQWSPHVPTVLDSAGTVFVSAMEDADQWVKEAALRRLPSLWPAIAVDGSSGPLVRIWMREAYGTAADLLASAEPSIRLAAARACIGAPFEEHDFRLVQLLQDEDAAVRKGVLIELAQSRRSHLQGSQKELVLPYLGDPDPATATAAERVLRLGGVAEESVALFKLRYSSQPDLRAKSAKAVVSLSQGGARNVATFLLNLSHDAAPEVRIAFVDAVLESSQTQPFHDRLRALAEGDPDLRVRARGKEALARLRVAGR